MNLFSWSSWVALKAADATVAQSEANFLAAQQSLVQRVTAQYFAVLAAQDTLSAQQSALQSVQIQLDQAEQRYNVGLLAITDVEIARASRDSTNAAVIAAKRVLATQNDLLRAITGESYRTLAGPGRRHAAAHAYTCQRGCVGQHGHGTEREPDREPHGRGHRARRIAVRLWRPSADDRDQRLSKLGARARQLHAAGAGGGTARRS